MKLRHLIPLLLLTTPGLGFEPTEWSVRCWNSDAKQWQDLGREKMTLTAGEGATTVTNTSGIHRHAHFVLLAELEGDFAFEIVVRGGYELGFLDREGRDEMLYVEIDEAADFETFVLKREGTRYSIERNGRVVPLVHFRFDYGAEIQITLAIKGGERAAIRSARFVDSTTGEL